MLTNCNSGMSRFGFEGGIRILIAQAPGNCILVTSNCVDPLPPGTAGVNA